MSHLRSRHLLPLLLKRLRFAPVVAVQGARQTGKSVLMRDLLAKPIPKAVYVSFDSLSEANLAERDPETYLIGKDGSYPLIIDEAQKVPSIFDTIKLSVDTARVPGRFILLGSTEFSHLTQIRESLTGRMSRVRLFPFTLSESHQLKLHDFKIHHLFPEKPRISRTQLLKHLHTGGMPAIFSVRDEAERSRLMQDWLDLTCERDLRQIKKLKLDPRIARDILEQIAKLDVPTAGNIAKALLKDLRKVTNHLLGLETLFVIGKLRPCTGSAGKDLYYLLDAGIATHLGSGMFQSLKTQIKTELDALLSYHDVPLAKLTYYQSRSGGHIDFILETRDDIAAIKILAGETFHPRDIEIFKSFRAKKISKKVHCYVLGNVRLSLKKEKIEIFPWENIA